MSAVRERISGRFLPGQRIRSTFDGEHGVVLDRVATRTGASIYTVRWASGPVTDGETDEDLEA